MFPRVASRRRRFRTCRTPQHSPSGPQSLRTTATHEHGYARRRASHRAQTLRSITHSKSQRGGRGKFCEHDAQIHGVYARLDDAHEHRTKRGVVGAQSCARAPPGRLAASVAVEREGRRRSTQDGGPSSELEREAYNRKRDAERRREGVEPARQPAPMAGKRGAGYGRKTSAYVNL